MAGDSDQLLPDNVTLMAHKRLPVVVRGDAEPMEGRDSQHPYILTARVFDTIDESLFDAAVHVDFPSPLVTTDGNTATEGF